MELTKDFLKQNWPIGDVADIQLITERGERKLYKVTTNLGTYAFKTSDPDKSSEVVIKKDTAVLDFLANESFSSPQIIKTTSSALHVRHNDQEVYALEYIEGNEPESTIENYKKLGGIIGKLHSISKPFSHLTDYTPEKIIPGLLERAKKHNLEERYVELIKMIPSFAGLPKTIIHTDIGLHNCIQKSSGEIIMLDWDDAGIGYPELDLGWVLINSFLKEDLSYESEKARAFFGGYASFRKLSQQEKDMVFWGGFLICLDYAFNPDGTVDRWEKAKFIVENKKMFEDIVYS